MMSRTKIIIRLVRMAALAICIAAALPCAAQKFSVISVNAQKNDISAFISPVRDLNGQACALLKVEAPKEFAFSTPLGIVKRVDETGEILLYLPSGSSRITIKHPEWGVLRNYRFPTPLESRICYVMKLNCPQAEVEEIHDTIVVTQILRDTVTVKNTKPKLPLASYASLTTSLHKSGPSFGIFLATMKRHGLFMHLRSDFRSIGTTSIEVNADGYVSGDEVMPFYTGNKRHSNFALTSGLIHRLTRHINVFEGVGYGKTTTAWQVDNPETSTWALCTDHSHKGIAAEAGLMWHNHRWCALMSASTVKCKVWQVNIGIGIKLGRQ